MASHSAIPLLFMLLASIDASSFEYTHANTIVRTQLFLIQYEHTYTQGVSFLQLLLLKLTHVIICAFLLKVI